MGIHSSGYGITTQMIRDSQKEYILQGIS